MSAVKKLRPVVEDIAIAGWEEFAGYNPAPEWLNALRLRSRDAYAAQGMPASAQERFKYTDIPTALKNKNLEFSALGITPAGNVDFIMPLDDPKLPEWARVMLEAQPAGEKTYGDMALWHAVNAFARDGLILDVPPGTTGQAPLDVALVGHEGAYSTPRTLLRVGANAEFTMIERHSGEGTYWNNRVTQIHVAKGARLRHYRIQDNSTDAVYTQNTHVVLERDATYEAFVLTTGAALSRNQIHVELQGENAEVRLAGANLLQGTQQGDTTITIEHQAPHCRSNQTYKTILADKAHGVFQGKVHVHQIAQKTDGYQLSNALLLSPQTIMDTKPELEIYADDVKCSHGATTGQLDTAPLFYLRTRGLSEAQAKFLLMQAYLGPALDEIRDDAARETISALAVEWLEKQTG